jgi:hypothetical protein
MPYDPKTNKWVGTTRRLNRENTWQKGPAGQQRPHVRVTTDFDVEWLEASPEVGIASQDIPDEEDEELEAFRKLYEKP